MAIKTSAGLLMYKIRNKELLVFLVHPGGPFWQHKDKGVWGIPKGERDNLEDDLFDVAKREFCEETSINLPLDAKFISLGSIKQANGKTVHAWAFENNENFKFECQSFVEIASSLLEDNENSKFADKSEGYIRFCEVDKGEFFNFGEAKEKILASQFELVQKLRKELNIKNISDKQMKLGF
jgi:predicted NUDIX family NTP pyrophosphohydrolase